MPEHDQTENTAELQRQLDNQFNPETDDRPDAIGPEDVNDDGEVISR